MHEIFPIAAGVLLGLVLLRISNPRLKTVLFIVGSVVFGVIATTISGEFRITWEFVLIDIPEVMLSAAAVVLLAPRAKHWVAARRQI